VLAGTLRPLAYAGRSATTFGRTIEHTFRHERDMTVGDGIFLSAVLLGLIGLFVATKDRWNWKRITKWGLGLPLVLVACVLTGLWGYSAYRDMPRAQAEFEGINLGSTQADVRFRKGEPVARHSTEDRLVYYVHSGPSEPGSAVLIVQFGASKIRHITYWANESQILTPYLLGFTRGSDYDTVLERLGPPSNVSISANGLSRLLSFEKYKVHFEFEQGKVRTFGIYEPSGGPMRFASEASTPDPAPKASSPPS
jgi:hypothetical protein